MCVCVCVCVCVCARVRVCVCACFRVRSTTRREVGNMRAQTAQATSARVVCRGFLAAVWQERGAPGGSRRAHGRQGRYVPRARWPMTPYCCGWKAADPHTSMHPRSSMHKPQACMHAHAHTRTHARAHTYLCGWMMDDSKARRASRQVGPFLHEHPRRGDRRRRDVARQSRPGHSFIAPATVSCHPARMLPCAVCLP